MTAAEAAIRRVPVDDALRLVALGHRVFPLRDKSHPLTTHGHLEATTNEAVIRAWWTEHPDALIGVRPQAEQAVVDLDIKRDPDGTVTVNGAQALMDAGFSLTETQGFQRTPGEGAHVPYRTDGRPVKNTSDWLDMSGVDLRTEKGYVVVYQPDEWTSADQWGELPEWAYEAYADARARTTGADAPARVRDRTLETDTAIVSWLGGLWNADGGQMTVEALVKLQEQALRDGRIVATDPARPWTAADFLRHAESAQTWEVTRLLQAPSMAHKPTKEDGMTAKELLTLDIPPLQWTFGGFLPEGLVVLGAPPKAGKSVLCYQMAVYRALGLDLLGFHPSPGPVRYYALEDGKRRSQTRIRSFMPPGREMPDTFDLRWTAPKLGGELEQEVADWLDVHASGLVIIDVLSKVRPAGSGRTSLNAYDEDYRMLSGIHNVSRSHAGACILIVTHDRKAGSEDWVSRITGTRGVSGVADSTMYIDRKRSEKSAVIHVTGRDAEDASIPAVFGDRGWARADAETILATMHNASRLAIFTYLKDTGPAWPKAIADATGMSHDVVKHRLQDMEKAGEVYALPDRQGYRAMVGK